MHVKFTFHIYTRSICNMYIYIYYYVFNIYIYLEPPKYAKKSTHGKTRFFPFVLFFGICSFFREFGIRAMFDTFWN